MGPSNVPAMIETPHSRSVSSRSTRLEHVLMHNFHDEVQVRRYLDTIGSQAEQNNIEQSTSLLKNAPGRKIVNSPKLQKQTLQHASDYLRKHYTPRAEFEELSSTLFFTSDPLHLTARFSNSPTVRTSYFFSRISHDHSGYCSTSCSAFATDQPVHPLAPYQTPVKALSGILIL